ncbi:hypothetical protein [Amycolatopsis sp. CA-230715]|uniref:hypothetical protein n=1 Tax=Amycolatopsis sp. CA-230715 TaxID=2745196 RepID=UPI001C01A45A|nr:hypothetical protein [Amycolatopsis sp. CA-230715]QWF85713.1 hypothetical protein HUW46_09193 [Amycolatopsis sp. CA-230715]
MSDDRRAELNDVPAASSIAENNLARIRAKVEQRPDAHIQQDFFSALLDTIGQQGKGSPMLRITAGSSRIEISAGADYYVITGTDCGQDWLHPKTRPSTLTGSVTVDCGPGVDAVVGASDIETLLGHAVMTSFPYDRVGNGRGGHELLHDYVDNWIDAHARGNESDRNTT